MVDIQQDVVDAAARAMTPHILKIAETALNAEEYGFNQKDKQDAKYMMDFLKDFKGDMSQDSIPATVYSYWHYFFYSGFLDDAHELVAEDVARFGGWHRPPVEVEVGAANGGGGNPQDDIVVLLDFRFGNVFDAHVVATLIDQCFHAGGSLQWFWLP